MSTLKERNQISLDRESLMNSQNPEQIEENNEVSTLFSY
jgi:hypothetical protein